MRASNNVCVLKLYKGVGHLFTHNLEEQEIPDYSSIDREISKQADDASITFIRDLGIIE